MTAINDVIDLTRDGDGFEPAPLLERLVAEGRGFKTL
jgi:hypothetical protein